MTAKIFFKLLLGALLVMIVALATIDFLASSMAEQAYTDGLLAEMQEKVRMLGALPEGLEPSQANALARAAGGRFTLIAASGAVRADSEADATHMENHAARPEFKAALEGRIGWAVRASPTLGERFLYVAGPVGGGAVRLAVPLREIRGQVNQLRLRLLASSTLAFLPAIVIAALLARYLSKRLASIIEYAHALARGDFKARLPERGSDELSLLSRQLNETGANLEKMFTALDREHNELEKLERIRRDFVINVSHELRTPLASIQGYTETLLNGAIDDKENNLRFLGIIRQNAERLTRLTADLLTLSKLELKSLRFQFAFHHAGRLLRDCADSLLPIAAKRNIAIAVVEPPAALEVCCDAEAVHQMIGNLLDNAIKYTPEGGFIEVSAAARPEVPGMVEFRVRDTGAGIPAEELPRLFERFYRVDKARSRELGGTGLGLAIVKHLALAQGGTVGVESAPGAGSTFSFTLPAEDLHLDLAPPAA